MGGTTRECSASSLISDLRINLRGTCTVVGDL